MRFTPLNWALFLGSLAAVACGGKSQGLDWGGTGDSDGTALGAAGAGGVSSVDDAEVVPYVTPGAPGTPGAVGIAPSPVPSTSSSGTATTAVGGAPLPTPGVTDGSVTDVAADGTITTEFPDGTVSTVYPDGSSVTVYPDGSMSGSTPVTATPVPVPTAAVVGSTVATTSPVPMPPPYGPIYPGGALAPEPLHTVDDLDPLPVREPSEDLRDTLAEIDELETQAAQTTCECEAEYWGTDYVSQDIAGCIRYRYGNHEPPPVAQCIEDYLVTTPVADESVECRLEASRELNRCLENVGCDMDRSWRCEDYYWRDYSDCPEYPFDLWATIEINCWGGVVYEPFVCNDGTRIQSWYACNWNADCPDGEDETEELCHWSTDFWYDDGWYGEDTVYCPEGSGPSYPMSTYELCDGYEACSDGWDERASTCEEYGIRAFACDDGHGIPESYVCDGVNDCRPGGEDEAGCTLY